jgi:hypothetical protein
MKYVYLSIPVLYVCTFIYRTPQIADALVTAFLAAFTGFLYYLDNRIETTKSQEKSKEYKELVAELELEQLKDSIEEFKFRSSQRNSRRDSANAGNLFSKVQF